MILNSIQALTDKLAAELAISAPGVVVSLGKPKIAQRDGTGNPVTGRVIVVPLAGQLTLPKIKDYGSNVPIKYATLQQLEIHCWARAPKNTDPARQYGDDLTQCEVLRGKVATVALKFFDGAALGGPCPLTEAGENTWGVELVWTVTVEISVRDLPLTLADPVTVFECDCDDELQELPAPPPDPEPEPEPEPAPDP